MMDWLTALHDGAAQFGLTLTAEQDARFARYLDVLLARNAQVNLTAITDPVEVAVKHFLDALTVETVWQPPPRSQAIDIGTGAGFPGLPLAIRHPEITIVLNDSTRKKVDFLTEAVAALELPHARPLWARAEELGHVTAHRGAYHAVFARAVASLRVLCEYALPLLVTGGCFVAMKGPSGAAEVDDSRQALRLLGGEVAEVRALTLPGAGERLLIVIRATRPTPAKYPRNAAVITRTPL